jgi:hypothetical protein
MSDPPATLEDLKVALASCLQAAKTVDRLRTIYIDPDDPYRPGIDAALVELLHLIANLCSKSRAFEEQEPPWLDCGPEPIGCAEAQKYLAEFLSLAANSLSETPAPFIYIEIRATTFALELDPKSEGSD